MKRFVAHLADVMRTPHVTEEGPAMFLAKVQEAVRVDAKTLRWGLGRMLLMGGMEGVCAGWQGRGGWGRTG